MEEPRESLEEVYRRLLMADLAVQLPGAAAAPQPQFGAADARRLLGHASVLSTSSDVSDWAKAYEIVTRLVELSGTELPGLAAAADIVLSRIGNFPGRRLLRRQCFGDEERAPRTSIRLRLERLSREMENTVLVAPAAEGQRVQEVILTEFQWELYAALETTSSVSVSAPTSAGKTFVLGLDLVRRLRKAIGLCVVYVVPTRALMSEVALEIRKLLRRMKTDVPVRTVPFPVSIESAPRGMVFVLTQERLLSLLHAPGPRQAIGALIIDEAQNIGDRARGVILQTAIEGVVSRNPAADVHFASPLTANPEFLLNIVHRGAMGKPLLHTLSPVSQNLLIVSQVKGKPRLAEFQLVVGDAAVELGRRDLGFKLRGGVYAQRAQLALAVTRPDESTLLYANEPSDAEELAAELAMRLPLVEPTPEIVELVDFMRTEVHEDYPLIECLRHGVAYHYGYMPAILRARVEELCRTGRVKFVCCTSTLLQGINLPVRHIIIEHPKKGRLSVMERADFLNLAGRAGRLLKEFHGNVWCLRATEWEDRSYQGSSLTPIIGAVDKVMADGGTLVQRVLESSATDREEDYGEAVFGKIYCDYVRGQRSLLDSPWRTDQNEEVLRETERRLQALNITLPTALLDANRSIRPDRLQSLYERLRDAPDVTPLLPLRPHTLGANDRMGDIIQTVQETLGGVSNFSHRYYKWLAIQWIYNVPLRAIIESRLEYLSKKGESPSVARVISELLSALEDAVRFRLVKYFMAYNAVLALVLRERGYEELAESLEPLYVFLECGATDSVALGLMGLGLSRSTALALCDQVQFPSDATPEACLARLEATRLEDLKIPALCVREIREMMS